MVVIFYFVCNIDFNWNLQMSSKKKPSKIWAHFVLSDCKKKAICKYCHGTLTYSIATMSNLSRHIKTKHAEIGLNDKNEAPVEIYSIEDVEEVGCDGLKTYEITMKSFEEMDHEEITPPIREAPDPDWTPESSAEWKTDEVTTEVKEKKYRKRSAVWNHFQKTSCNTTGVCMHCGKTIRLGTVSNLARHLRQKHPTIPFTLNNTYVVKPESSSKYDEQDFPMLTNSEGEISAEVVEVNVNDLQNPERIIETKLGSACNFTHHEFQNNDINDTNVTQSSQTEFLEDNEEFDINDYIKPYKTAVLPKQVDQQLVRMIVKGCHTLNIVEQTSFINFVKLLNPKYQLPSVNKISKELIPGCYNEVEKRARSSLQHAEGVCLYLDEWKFKSNIYFCVSAHFINSECKFDSLFLSCSVLSDTENADDISEKLLHVANVWGITEKIVGVVTVNSERVFSALQICKWPSIPHFFRALTAVVYESLLTFNPLLSKVSTLSQELTQSPGTVAKIYARQKALNLHPVKLIKRVKTTSSSAFLTIEMFTRIVKLKTAICHVQKQSDGIKLTEYEWKVLNRLVEFYKIFKAFKNDLLNEERVILSKIIFYVRNIKSEIKKFKSLTINPSEVTFVATVAESEMNNQFKILENMDLISSILLLDPRLKKYVFEDESESALACSTLKKEVCEMQLPDLSEIDTEPDPSSIWYSFDIEVKKLNAVKDPIGKGILELENYLQEQLLNRNEDPLLWWKERHAIYPRLFKLAKKYLCVTSNSTLHESISFKSAYMLSQIKNSNLSSLQSEVMFLHHNL